MEQANSMKLDQERKKKPAERFTMLHESLAVQVRIRDDVFCEGSGLWEWVSSYDTEFVNTFGECLVGTRQFRWDEIDIEPEERDALIKRFAEAAV
jgi:hypothetical protein